MYTVMITGGIGSGKSTALAFLRSRGAAVLSLDAISRELLTGSSAMKDEIVRAFGEDVLGEEGDIEPARLAKIAFATQESAQLLDSITFPYIIEAANTYILNVHCTPTTKAPLLAVEVPLLAEAPELASLADEVISISAPEGERIVRAVERGGETEDIMARIALQATDADREKIAHTVIENTGTPEEFEEKLAAWWDMREAAGWRR
ncbi:MAG: dephospho-CoA kinase [Actinobacteria bacterium]|nr:dephospho-CoA kinase [Actinomycetota bacterium]